MLTFQSGSTQLNGSNDMSFGLFYAFAVTAKIDSILSIVQTRLIDMLIHATELRFCTVRLLAKENSFNSTRRDPLKRLSILKYALLRAFCSASFRYESVVCVCFLFAIKIAESSLTLLNTEHLFLTKPYKRAVQSFVRSFSVFHIHFYFFFHIQCIKIPFSVIRFVYYLTIYIHSLSIPSSFSS